MGSEIWGVNRTRRQEQFFHLRTMPSNSHIIELPSWCSGRQQEDRKTAYLCQFKYLLAVLARVGAVILHLDDLLVFLLQELVQFLIFLHQYLKFFISLAVVSAVTFLQLLNN